MTKTKRRPTPEELMAKVNALPPTEDMTGYIPAMKRLREKGFTLRKTADFLSNELGRRVTHTMVYRLLRDATPAPPEILDDEHEYIQQQLDERKALRDEFEVEERVEDEK
jgi:hypothetical protein